MGTEEKVHPARPAGARARIFAMAALASIAAVVTYVGHEAYRAATDSFVAPTILSPDSDIVIAGKLHASQLNADRSRTASDLDAIREAIGAGEKAIERLKGLQRTPASASAWTSDVNNRQVSAGVAEERMLLDKNAVLHEMATRQERLVNESHVNLEAGLTSATDYAKELQIQNELQLALLENERSRHQVHAQVAQASAAQQSIAGTAPPTPEAITREEQAVRIELEIMRLASERRAKELEQARLVERMAMLDELDAQLKTRPAYRASDRSMDVAFVPYTQMNGVFPSAAVYECIWGVFHCKAVGEVTELFPGEVTLADPWGNQARGQYAVLKLTDHESAKAKTLRVRAHAPSGAPKAPADGPRVSSK